MARLCDTASSASACGPEMPLVSRSWWHLSLSGWPRATLVTEPSKCRKPSVHDKRFEGPLANSRQAAPRVQTADSSTPTSLHADPLSDRTLHSADDDSEWTDYLTAVYGPSLRWPVRLDSLTWLYWTAPVEIDVTCGTTFEVNAGPIKPGVWLDIPPGTAWLPKYGKHTSRNPYLPASDFGVFVARKAARGSAARPAGAAWLEVLRFDQPSTESSKTGTWFSPVTGSGIWLERGRQGRHLDLTCVRTQSGKFMRDVPTNISRWADDPACRHAAIPETLPSDSAMGLALGAQFDTMQRTYWRDGRPELADFREKRFRAVPNCGADP